jgi:beta-barrel assembly-enhancing protease
MRPVCLALLLSTIPALGQQQAARGVNWFSFEKEEALGRGLAEDFRRRNPSIDDEVLRSYIVTVTARLNQFAQSPFPLSIEISANADTKLEPAAFPGGFLFAPLGLLVAARDEAELAGPLAHALAHIAARHGTRQATRGEIVNLATIPLVFVGGGWENDRQLLIPLGFRKFQLEQEAEADGLASRWMAEAGYPPIAWAAYLERVQPSSLRPIAERVAALSLAPAPATLSETGDFAAIQQRALTLVPPPAEPKPPPTLRRKQP